MTLDQTDENIFYKPLANNQIVRINLAYYITKGNSYLSHIYQILVPQYEFVIILYCTNLP